MTGKLSWWRRARTGREVATCREVGRVLQAYLDGHVDELTARRVARHLEMCRRCGMEASTYAEIKRSLARRGADVDPVVVERLRDFGTQLIEHDDDEPPQERA